MKKAISLLLACMMIASLSACGGSTAAPAAPAAPATPAAPAAPAASAGDSQFDENGFMKMDETDITMAVGSAGATWYVAGAAFGDAFSELLPMYVTLLPGGGSSNPTLTNDGDVQVGFTYKVNATSAVNGTNEYDKKHENLKALACLNIKQYLTIATTDKFTSVEEMVANPKSVRIAVGPRAGGNEVTLNRYLEQLGTSLDELSEKGMSVQYISASDGMDAIKDGNANVANYLAAIPLTNYVEALASTKMSFVSLEEGAAKAAADKYGYTYTKIPAGSYQYQDEDVMTICDTVILVVNSDVDDAVAYNMAKILAENKDRWVSAHSAFNTFETADVADCGIALHPGAEAYYKSAGLL